MIEDNGFLLKLFNAFPSAAFVVDEDVRIRFYNSAASKLLGEDRDKVYAHRGGEALHCIHSIEVPEGCAHARVCKQCVIRNSVSKAVRGGSITRAVMKAELAANGSVAEIYLMVSAAPFLYQGESLAVLFIEDITEVVQLRDLMPICSHCKKIRDDEKYWQSIEEYLATRHSIYLSHGICPECAEKVYGGILKGFKRAD